MRMSDAIGLSSFGLVFFLGHLARAIQSARTAGTREDRLEAWGKVVPGLAGLFLVAAMVARPWPIAQIALLAFAFGALVPGRAIYEVVVFRPDPPR